jgi:hypothetical protein
MSERAPVAIEDWTPHTKVLTAPGSPTLLARWRVSLGCGCCVWVGIRADDGEAATGACACQESHRTLMRRFNDRMRAGLEHPSDRQLVDVVAETLES